MPKKINVLRPFTFSYPLESDKKLHRERHCPKGEIEIDDEMAAHPWIKDHFADGCIETPAQAEARAAAAQAIADKIKEDNDRILAEAEAAFARTVQQSATVLTASDEQLQRELNTPVNQLGAAQGAGIVSATPAAVAPVTVPAAAVTTPVPATAGADNAPATGDTAPDGKDKKKSK